jgi:hypothetical protein
MNELDDHARELLSQARRALSPSRDDEARLLQRTLHAARSGYVPEGASKPASFMRTAARGGGKLVVALSIAGLSGSIGFVLGQRAERGSPTRVAPVALAPSKPDIHEAAPTVDRPSQEQPPSTTPAAPTEHAEAGARTRAQGAAKKLDARTAKPVAIDEFADLKRGAGSSLELEVRFMKAVERALRDDDPGQALRVLDELEQAVPQGSLDEERRAASVMARCRLGLGDRTRLIEELTSRYPASAYTQRVQASCRKRQ